MKRIKLFLSICVLVTVTMLSGCGKNESEDIFATASLPVLKISEDVTATTEFPEYNSDTEEIIIYLVNSGESDFELSDHFRMQKMENDKWRDLAVEGIFGLYSLAVPAGDEDYRYRVVLKDHVQLPLPPGEYRIGVGDQLYITEDYLIAYTEFTIK